MSRYGQKRISIHAPVKGATTITDNKTGKKWISIHAPVKGATLLLRDSSKGHKDFNPRTREGCDSKRILKIALQQHFNPRTREGCDFAKLVKV